MEFESNTFSVMNAFEVSAIFTAVQVGGNSVLSTPEVFCFTALTSIACFAATK